MIPAVIPLLWHAAFASQGGPPAPGCEPPVPPEARCTTIEVWENRAAGSGRRIPLRVVVLPRLDSVGSGPGPRQGYFVLTGGPGQGAATTEGRAAAAYRDLRRTHDIVLVDQRGTGASGPLGCPMPARAGAFFGSLFPREAVSACRDSLARRSDLRLYGTAEAMDDLDEVRAALGYEVIDLEGQSYGTRAARVYARRHPSRVRTMVLIGVVPDDFRLPASYAVTLDASLEAVVADCAREPACAAAHPRLRDHLAAAVARLRTAPAPVRVPIPRARDTLEARLGLGDFAYGLRGLLYGAGALRIPDLIERAAAGDFSPIAEAYLGRAMAAWGALSVGLHLAVVCAEDVPHLTEADRQASRGTIAGAYLIDEYRAACREFLPDAEAVWPDRGSLPDVPVLLLSGRRDPVTPPALAARVAAGFRDQLHLVFPTGGHGYWGATPAECVARIRDRFVAHGTTRGLDPSCVR